jgi:hypothetical protein
MTDERITDGTGTPAIGSVSEEAAKLLEAMGDWMARHAGSAGEHIATGAPECLLCPICRAISAARSAGPDLVEHLGDALGSIVSAVRALADAADRQRRDQGSAQTQPGLEHIDIS